MDAAISVENINQAAGLIDPVFRDSPQFVCEPISERLDVETLLKVEFVNPIRSFKGRGADYLVQRLGEDAAGGLVCASAGNFGQGMAYACRKAGRKITVFASRAANSLKIERMRALGAEVVLEGEDFDAAKDAAKHRASVSGARYIEDGLLGPISEGAGTIAVELGRLENPLDAIFVPLGNGALVNGIGAWLKHASARTRVIAVCSSEAPAMERSWREGRPISAPAGTIADGIAVRVPVAEALEIMRQTVDEVMLVSDAEILETMRMLFSLAGLAVEPAGAAGMAAIAQRRGEWAGRRVATPLCGSNLTAEQLHDWL
ncbi:MAG TPA: pyridoxal-phosphate dependent enzyme [Candidatus Baltobacterales bacterium]|nr:pyridoxal-phosphate dependent enzyme [Candidatus Baltobacterales bacterium]